MANTVICRTELLGKHTKRVTCSVFHVPMKKDMKEEFKTQGENKEGKIQYWS